MPQLVKGGKYVFGWSLVHETGKIMIPEEAYFEYEFNTSDKIVIIPGSSTSGGFSIASINHLIKGPFKEILKLLNYSEEAKSFEIPELELRKYKKKRFFCWIRLEKAKYFILNPRVLNAYGVEIGEKLLVCRGSGYALAFIGKGPIIETARKYSELKTFK